MENTSPSSQTFQTLLTDCEVAALLQVSKSALRRWRRSGEGPRFSKIGACVRYRLQDISDYVEHRARVQAR